MAKGIIIATLPDRVIGKRHSFRDGSGTDGHRQICVRHAAAQAD